MKRLHVFIVLPLVALFSAQSPPPGGPGPGGGPLFHIGHYEDVRALCRVGDSLWIGTGGGAFIYDLGSSEITGRETIGGGLPSNSIRAISARGDSVYVGTDEGLSIFTSDTALVFSDAAPGPFRGAPLSLIRGIDYGLDNLVYLSTFGRGLGVLAADTAWVITQEDSLLDNKVFGMTQEADTTFYFATSTGLCAFRDSLWVSFRAGAGIPRAEVRQIEPAPQGGYYLVVGRRGVYWFDGDRSKRITYPALFPENAVAAIAVDAGESLWACGRFGGVGVYRNGHWTRFGSADDGHRTRRWRSAAADASGGVFFGSADGKVLWIRDDVATEIRLPQGLPSGGVRAITADSSGVVYLLNDSYLIRVAPGLDTFTPEHDSPVVVAFAVSPQGEVWTATRWGIYRRYENRYIGVDTRLSERQPVFSAIGFDARGALWVGTQAGNVHRFDGQIWMRMGDAGELALGPVRAIAPDGAGRLWVTGSNGGVAMYRYGRWKVFGPQAFGDRPVKQIAVAPNGVPVLATDAGLWGFDESGEWKVLEFTQSDRNGEPTGASVWDPDSPPILSLGFDATGRLYAGTEDGVAEIGESGIRWITARDGIGGSAVASVLATGTGALWLGFRTDGLTRMTRPPAPDEVGPVQD